MNYPVPKIEWLNIVKVTTNFGKGINGDPVRNVDYFYDEDTGELLFILDKWLLDELRKQEGESINAT